MGSLLYSAFNNPKKRIMIACHYFDFLMENSNLQNEKVELFRQYIQKNQIQKALFVQVIQNQDRTLCEDEMGFGVAEDQTKQLQWNQIKIILGIIPQETN